MSPETRHRFARNTCNGCHTLSETGGAEFQVRPRFPFQESQLSGFLTGADVTDFAAGVVRHFNELRRRGRILHDLVCPEEMLPPPPPETTPIGGGMGGPDGGFPPPKFDAGVIPRDASIRPPKRRQLDRRRGRARKVNLSRVTGEGRSRPHQGWIGASLI